MELISNILICAAAFGTALYCAILSRRLRRFTDLEHGIGGAVAVLVSQVDDLKKTLSTTRKAAEYSSGLSEKNLARAEAATRRLELLIASMSDLEAREPVVEKPVIRATAASATPSAPKAEDVA